MRRASGGGGRETVCARPWPQDTAAGGAPALNTALASPRDAVADMALPSIDHDATRNEDMRRAITMRQYMAAAAMVVNDS